MDLEIPAGVDVFSEDFNQSSDDDGDVDNQELLLEDVSEDFGHDSEQTEEEICGDKLSISEELARANYAAAGTEVEEERDRITVAGNIHLMNSAVNDILSKIVSDIELPYLPSEFQRVAINTVGMKRNLVLVSPTGSGKMDVPLLSVLVLRESLNNKKGVAIVTQPLTR